MVNKGHRPCTAALFKESILRGMAWLIPVLIIAGGSAGVPSGSGEISLAREWEFQIDTLDRGITDA